MSEPARVRSPCVSICALDDDDICTGCQRSGMEIATWGRMSEAQRREVLQRCEARARSQGLWLDPVNEKGQQA